MPYTEGLTVLLEAFLSKLMNIESDVSAVQIQVVYKHKFSFMIQRSLFINGEYSINQDTSQ